MEWEKLLLCTLSTEGTKLMKIEWKLQMNAVPLSLPLPWRRNGRELGGREDERGVEGKNQGEKKTKCECKSHIIEMRTNTNTLQQQQSARRWGNGARCSMLCVSVVISCMTPCWLGIISRDVIFVSFRFANVVLNKWFKWREHMLGDKTHKAQHTS